MSAPRFDGFKRLLLALCLAVFSVSAARAGDIEHAAQILDTITAKLPPGTDGALPFTGQNLRDMGDLIKHCEYASDADTIIACIDDWSSSPAGQGAGIPSWFPQMLDVYLDIEEPDYWGLFQDAGEAAACTVAYAFSGGVDICGAIKELIDAAKDVIAAGEAVGQFLGDLGSSVADFLCTLFCGSDGPEPLKENEKAYQYFYLPRIAHGLEVRLSGKTAWVNYSGEGENFQPQIVSEGLAAPGGFTLVGLTQALPRFIAEVNAQWDVKMFAQAQEVQKAAHLWNADRAQQYVGGIANGAGGLSGWKAFSYWKSTVASSRTKAHDDCVGALNAAGGGNVDVWIAAGGSQRMKAAPGFPWPDAYPALCNLFDAQLKALLQPMLLNAYSQYFNSGDAGCPKSGDTYTCLNKGVTQDCKVWMQMQGKSTMLCQWGGPGKGVFNCKGVFKLLELPPPLPNGYPGCTRQGFQGMQPEGPPDKTL